MIPNKVIDGLVRPSARDQASFGGLWNAAITLNTADTDGVKSSAATPIVETTYVLANFNGVLVDATGNLLDVDDGTPTPRSVSILTTTQANAYNTTDPILINGIWWWTGLPVTLSVYLTLASGNETRYTSDLLSSITSIVVPAQLLDTGTITVGCGIATALQGNKSPHNVNGGGSRAIYVGGTGIVAPKLMFNTAEDAVPSYAAAPVGFMDLWVRSLHEATTATGLVRCL